MTQLLEEYYFTKGPVIVRGKTTTRGEARKVDYVLFYKPNIPIAVVEAKDNNHPVGAGMQQAVAYAEALDVPFAYSSNGDAFLEHDRTATTGTVEREFPLGQFPTPEELWQRYSAAQGYNAAQESIATQDYYDYGLRKTTRYYQRIAINRTVDAIARGENRVLLVMATGTGKTYTAFQIIWRLWKSGAKKRILLLVDRNVLADQTKTNDFKPFGQAMTKITNRTADKAFEIYRDFRAPEDIVGAVTLLPKLFDSCAITRNFDRVLESVYENDAEAFIEKVTGRGQTGAFFRAIPARDRYLLKLDGNLDNPGERILNRAEYDAAYGNDGNIHFEFPLAKLLKRLFTSYSFLFLGCSLSSDRTIQTFMRVAQLEGQDNLPHHYALLACPTEASRKSAIDQRLGEAHITPLWYPEGEHQHVEQILELLLE